MSDWNEICRRPDSPPPAHTLYIAPQDGDDGDPLPTWVDVGCTRAPRGLVDAVFVTDSDIDDARVLASHDGFGALSFEFDIESSPALAALIYGASLTVAQQDHRPELTYQADQAVFDLTPDACWRCDAKPAADDFGLCPPCRVSLTREDLT